MVLRVFDSGNTKQTKNKMIMMIILQNLLGFSKIAQYFWGYQMFTVTQM